MIRHIERHRTDRIGWLRVRGSGRQRRHRVHRQPGGGCGGCRSDPQGHLVAGVAGLVAGAMSMAAGEYVSVSSQSDTEQADLERERMELADDPDHEHARDWRQSTSSRADPKCSPRRWPRS